MLISCGKQVPSFSFCQASGIMPVPERLAFPWRSARGPSELSAPRTAAIRQRGIVADWKEWGKRKLYEGTHQGAHPLHSFSTSATNVQIHQRTYICAEIFT